MFRHSELAVECRKFATDRFQPGDQRRILGASGMRIDDDSDAHGPVLSVSREQRSQIPTREARCRLGDLFGRTFGDDKAAALATLGSQIDHPVGALDDIQVVLDDKDAVSRFDEPMQNAEQPVDVFKVKSRRRFIEKVQRSSGVSSAQFFGKLDALRFTTRQRRLPADRATDNPVPRRRACRGWGVAADDGKTARALRQ